MILVSLWVLMSKERLNIQEMTHTESHPWNSVFMACKAVWASHVAGSEVSGCERTMLKALPAPIVYVITCLESPILWSGVSIEKS